MLALITWHCEFWFIDWAISCTGHRISAVKTPVAVHYQVQRLAFRRPLVGLVEHREQQAVCPRRSLEASGSSLNDEFITFFLDGMPQMDNSGAATGQRWSKVKLGQ